MKDRHNLKKSVILSNCFVRLFVCFFSFCAKMFSTYVLAPLPTTACESDDPIMSLFEANSMQRWMRLWKHKYLDMLQVWHIPLKVPLILLHPLPREIISRFIRISLPHIWPFWRNKRPTKFKHALPFDNNSLFSPAISKA